MRSNTTKGILIVALPLAGGFAHGEIPLYGRVRFTCSEKSLKEKTSTVRLAFGEGEPTQHTGSSSSERAETGVHESRRNATTPRSSRAPVSA